MAGKGDSQSARILRPPFTVIGLIVELALGFVAWLFRHSGGPAGRQGSKGGAFTLLTSSLYER
jgi:hypothetical protein